MRPESHSAIAAKLPTNCNAAMEAQKKLTVVLYPELRHRLKVHAWSAELCSDITVRLKDSSVSELTVERYRHSRVDVIRTCRTDVCEMRRIMSCL